MCGICGVVSLAGPLDPRLESAIAPMTATLRHRGPDGEGFFRDGTAALGHRRLAIIDRAGGAQPMSNEDGSCWVVFNGEIYNHRQLRTRLIGRGHVYRTTSDTETILHACEEFGTGALSMLEGMFAFAVYDSRRRELLLARDRLGKKPLYYAVLGGALHFASEIKAIRASPAWDPTIDTSELEGYLSLGCSLAPHTIYRQVRQLLPGHWLRLRNGRIEQGRYWDVERFDDHPAHGADLLEEVEAQVRSAVVDRLESEVPLGAFLSGGIDSGLVVAFMSGAMGPGVATTSVGFSQAAHNELPAAALTARCFETDHHVESVEPQLDGILDRIVGAFDEPYADASAIPTYHVSRLARRHTTVALTGDGGDETFGGYSRRYVPHAVEGAVRPLVPGPARALAGWMGARWPSHQLPRVLRFGTYLENLAHDPADAYYSDLCMVKPHVARRLLGLDPDRDPRSSPVYAAVTEPYQRCASPDPVQRAQYADLKIYLANDILVKVDRMSMQNSLEVRCPLLDHRLVELAFRIPRHRKLPGLKPKYLLRQLARRHLPSGLSDLPKHGFTTPIAEWLAGPCAPMFHDDVLHKGASVADLVDQDYVRRMFEEHRSARADHASALWAVWMLARWQKAAQKDASAFANVEMLAVMRVP